jgi:energy-coupling factor transporter ATP-binding protein EcfA2
MARDRPVRGLRRGVATRAAAWLDGAFPGAKRHRAAPVLHSISPASSSLDALPARGPVASPENARSLRVCLIGPTNAGKSTLLNQLLGTSVSIVSDKIHTTRENTLGYLTDDQAAVQIEFIDAPGSLGPSVPVLRRAIWDAVRASDLAFVVVDAPELSRPGAGSARLYRQLGGFLSQLSAELDAQEAQSAQPSAAQEAQPAQPSAAGGDGPVSADTERGAGGARPVRDAGGAAELLTRAAAEVGGAVGMARAVGEAHAAGSAWAAEATTTAHAESGGWVNESADGAWHSGAGESIFAPSGDEGVPHSSPWLAHQRHRPLGIRTRTALVLNKARRSRPFTTCPPPFPPATPSQPLSAARQGAPLHPLHSLPSTPEPPAISTTIPSRTLGNARNSPSGHLPVPPWYLIFFSLPIFEN